MLVGFEGREVGNGLAFGGVCEAGARRLQGAADLLEDDLCGVGDVDVVVGYVEGHGGAVEIDFDCAGTGSHDADWGCRMSSCCGEFRGGGML